MQIYVKYFAFIFRLLKVIFEWPRPENYCYFNDHHYYHLTISKSPENNRLSHIYTPITILYEFRFQKLFG